MASDTDANKNAIEARGLTTRFGTHLVHDALDLDVQRAETFASVGGSGSGKSTLLREMIMLHRPDAGSIRMLDFDVLALDEQQAVPLRQRIGVMFQQGGLFASMTVAENVGMPLREFTRLDDRLIDDIAAWKIALTGLEADASLKTPSELSGGMQQRAARTRSGPGAVLTQPSSGSRPAATCITRSTSTGPSAMNRSLD